jgi:uncharacterized repeat protein (TIGR01451 family)
VKSTMPLVAVAMTLALSAPPVATAANTPDEVSIVTTVDQPDGPGAPGRQTATVTDTGGLPVVGLHIRLDLAPGCEWFVLFLVPGDTVTVTCAGTPGDPDGVVTAAVSGHDLLGRRVRAGSTTTLRPPHPAVRLDATAAPSLAVPGQAVHYTVSVTNSGDVPLHGLAVTTIGPQWCGRSVPGLLAPGASVVIDCTTTAGRRDRSTEFRVSGRDTFGTKADATATVDVAVPGLALSLSGPPRPTPAGHDALITVRLTDTSSVALSDLHIAGMPATCDNDLPRLAGGTTVTYTCPTTVNARTVVALVATGLPAVDGTPVPGAESVTENSTVVLLSAAATPLPTATTPEPTPTRPRIVPPLAAPAVVLSPQATRTPTRRPTPTAAAPAQPLRPPVTRHATGPLANPGRTALVIAVLAVLVMTVSVGAFAAATRPGK